MSWPSGTSSPSVLFPEIMETPVQTQPPEIEIIETQPHERQDNPRRIRQQTADYTRVGLELSKSSVVKQRELRSDVWMHFKKYKDEYGKDWASCKVCEKVFDGSSKSGTTHLRNHFKSCQRKSRNRGEGGDEPAQLAGNLSNSIAIEENSVMDQQLNHLDAARRIIKQGNASLISSTNMGYIFDVYIEEKEKLCNYFAKLSCRFCLTFRISEHDEDYICLMVWFIDEDWNLKNKIIGLKRFDDIENGLSEWGIKKDLSCVVLDRHYLLMMGELGEIRHTFINRRIILPGKRSLCTASLLWHCDGRKYYHLPRFINNWVKNRLCRIFNSIRMRYFESENPHHEIDALIKSLGKEVTAENFFPEDLELEKKCISPVDSLGLLKNVLGLKETFFHLESTDPHFQNLTEEEWNLVTATYQFYDDDCSEINIRMQRCSNCYVANTHYTANTHFPPLCRMYKYLKEFRKCDILDSTDKFLIWERVRKDLYEYNIVLAVASVFDPRFKMDIVKNWYKNIFGGEWETEFTKFTDYFTNCYNDYVRHINNFKSCSSASDSEETNSSISYKMLDPMGKSCKPSHELNSELDLYLEEVKFPLFEDFDVLEWWRVHARYFPTLARMARDLLSIQISCHPCRVSDEEKESIKDLGINEAYICTKSWLCEELG